MSAFRYVTVCHLIPLPSQPGEGPQELRGMHGALGWNKESAETMRRDAP